MVLTLIFAVLGGMIPMVIYAGVLYLMDQYEKEPLGLIIGAFVWGLIPAAVLSLIAEMILGLPLMFFDESGALADLTGTIFLAPITEEFFKGMAVFAVYLVWRDEFDGVFDGIIYGGLVGFGFAAIENILYFLSMGLDLFFWRAILFGLNHALFTALTGIGFGVARHTRSEFLRFLAPLAGLLTAMLAHGLHNTSVTLTEGMPLFACFAVIADWGGVVFILVIMVLATLRERRWITEQLSEEISRQVLTRQQYEIVRSPFRRFGARFEALARGGPALWMKAGRFYQMLTKLAFKKHAHARRGESGARTAKIDELRARVAILSAELSASSQNCCDL